MVHALSLYGMQRLAGIGAASRINVLQKKVCGNLNIFESKAAGAKVCWWSEFRFKNSWLGPCEVSITVLCLLSSPRYIAVRIKNCSKVRL